MKDKNYIFECLAKQQPIIDVEFEFAGYVDFENKEYKSIVFENCVFNDKVHFTNATDISGFHLINCQFNKVVKFEQLNDVGEIELDNCIFKSIYLEECEAYLLKINECQILGRLVIKDLKIDDASIEIKDIQVVGDIIIDSKEIETLYITSEKEASFHSIVLYNFKLIQINAKVILVKLLANNFTKLEIVNSNSQNNYIDNLTIHDLNFIGNIYTNNVKIDVLTLSHIYSSTGIIKIIETDIRITHINNCYIDNLTLNQVKFIEPPNIQSSDLSKLKMTNITWSDKWKSLENSFWKIPLLYKWRKKALKKRNKHVSEDQITLLKYHIETYRQLKVSSISSHNLTDTLVFYRNEMKLYWKLIRIGEDISWNDRILVFLNRWMSDFGQNYWLPLMWIAIFQTFFSVLIWNFEACKHCVEGTTCVNNFWSGLSQYLNWINPIFKAPENWSDGAKITSFFMRIFNGFFIFHFVKAIRKYGK